MNTIPQLKAESASYLQREVNDFYQNGIDLLLTAINAGHVEAQKHRDFELAKCTVDIPVSLNRGAPIGAAVLHGTTDPVIVKKILRAGYVDPQGGGIMPVKFVSQGTEAYDRWLQARQTYRWSPPPQQDGIWGGYVVQSGTQLYYYGQSVLNQNPVTLMFDVVQIFPDYVDDESGFKDDFLLQYGYEYLMWYTVVRCNYLVKEFVQREEGNLPTPKDERDAAWNKLIAWDASLVTSGDNSLDLD